MVDIVLLLGRRASSVDSEFVRSVIDSGTTVVSAQVPSFSPVGGMVREEWTGAHHQHGVDLARAGSGLRLRDVVLVTIPEPRTCRLAMLHVWTSPESTYDIDSVRVPWEEVAEYNRKTGRSKKFRVDKRNNPLGKNPTNFWWFSAPPGDLQPAATVPDAPKGEANGIVTLGSGIELNAFERVVLAHSTEGGSVHIWAEDDDYDILSRMASSLGREAARVPEGESDEFTPIPVLSSPCPEARGEGVIEEISTSRKFDDVEVTATAKIQDCRGGIRGISEVPITNVVTSPPYNIRYQPFNVPKPDSSGEYRAPKREGYDDELSPEQYAGLLQSTFREIDAKSDPDHFDLFLNVKSNYSGGGCGLPFYMLDLMPERWGLLDVLVWRYDISFDPGRGKYKPQYEWVIRVGFGEVSLPDFGMMDWYIPILKGNSKERKGLVHPAMFPRDLVKRCLEEPGRPAGLVLDPFLGSGTTLAACLELGVSSIGFEKSAKFLPDISMRLDSVPPLTDGSPGGMALD